jgi:Spy/CpxP family protein refolding chaperone
LLGLLRSEAVQKELNLVDDQKTALTEMGQKVFGNMRDQFAGLRDLDQAARDAKLAELRKQTQQRTVEAEKEVEKILLPQQFQRAKGILVQAEGTRALSDPAIADDLGLSAQQRSQLEAIQNAVREVMRQAFTGGPDASQEQRRAGFEKMQAAQKEADQRARAVLTPQQQQKLEQMKGEPFDVQQLRRGGPGGPGGPPPGGPGGPPPGA